MPDHTFAKPCLKESLYDVPAMPGVYAIWKDEELIYVGEAGKAWKPDKPPKTSHVKYRLSDHFRGTKNDVFVIYIFERFLGRNLSDKDWDKIEAGERGINFYAKQYIQSKLKFTFVSTTEHSEAMEYENVLRRGGLGQKPTINPLE